MVRHRWLWHLGFWLLYALSRLLPYYLTVMYYDVRLLHFMLYMELVFVATVYLTVWLYRYFCGKGRYVTYGALGLCLWALYLVIFSQTLIGTVADVSDFPNANWQTVFIRNATKHFFVFVIITMAKYFKDNIIYQYYENQRKQLQLSSELENLKAQIAPHFLFNTMNNLYGLAVVQSEQLPGLMVRLSELLRYALYETQHPTVLLTKDIANLLGYIELEKIRLEDNLEFEYTSNIPADCQVNIAPLLLVVFVENAFKHAKKVQNAPIRIHLNVQVDATGKFMFLINNNCRCTEIGADDPFKGIGLSNVKKRLEVLYPPPLHQLTIRKTANDFEVSLVIQLQKFDG